jgi:hypothetical protein
VTVTAILLVMLGVLGVLFAWLIFELINDDTSHGESVSGWPYALAYVQLAMSGLQIAAGVMVWVGRAWARKLAIVLCSISILTDLFSIVSQAPSALAGIVLNIGLIRLLTHDDVADWCDSHDSA